MLRALHMSGAVMAGGELHVVCMAWSGLLQSTLVFAQHHLVSDIQSPWILRSPVSERVCVGGRGLDGGFQLNMAFKWVQQLLCTAFPAVRCESLQCH